MIIIMTTVVYCSVFINKSECILKVPYIANCSKWKSFTDLLAAYKSFPAKYLVLLYSNNPPMQIRV